MSGSNPTYPKSLGARFGRYSKICVKYFEVRIRVCHRISICDLGTDNEPMATVDRRFSRGA